VLIDTGEEEDDRPPSTQGSSPSPDPVTGAATSLSFTSHADDDRTCAHAPEATTTRSEEVQRIISSWERIARVPMLAELHLSSTGSALEWRRLVLGEAAPVGARIEAIIFEEVRKISGYSTTHTKPTKRENKRNKVKYKKATIHDYTISGSICFIHSCSAWRFVQQHIHCSQQGPPSL
jgi:hypothetical protein